MIASLPGVDLFYTDSGGDGAPLVLLHANTGNADSWAHQFGPFAEAGYRVIAFDRRGWARSVPRPDTGPQPGCIAEDLDALATHLALPRFHLLGVAGGGFAALDYAAWRGDRLRSLIVGASYGQFIDPAITEPYSRIATPAFKALPSEMRELGPSYRGFEPAGLARWIEIDRHAMRADGVAQPLRTPNSFAKVAAIGVPALVIAGGADLYAPPRLMQLWASNLRRHEFQVIAEAGHAINWEAPAAFNAMVLDFLARATATSPAGT
ncbi:alpha/beta fold hydrolase [Falsiroseomonas ponticola]|uniref:alpha/beta fold hydrolase n=1 Tax=Falsiroseomonas ponticola TaxID=2786951 RepID=UPI0019322B50|nr:alpha/beta hydrolase [Roseomonas ponticola]